MAGVWREEDIDAFAPIGDLPPYWRDVPGLMVEFGSELVERTATMSGAPEVLEVAIWAHMELVAIHPFRDGNGRTARLVMNVPIMRHITGPTRPLDIPAEQRDRYLDCVQAARQGRSDGFIDLLVHQLEVMADGPPATQTTKRRRP